MCCVAGAMSIHFVDGDCVAVGCFWLVVWGLCCAMLCCWLLVLSGVGVHVLGWGGHACRGGAGVYMSG